MSELERNVAGSYFCDGRYFYTFFTTIANLQLAKTLSLGIVLPQRFAVRITRRSHAQLPPLLYQFKIPRVRSGVK